MLNIIEKKNRAFDGIDSDEDILKILKKEFATRKLRLKNFVDEGEIQISEFLDDGTIIVVTEPDFSPENDKITIYGLLDKYLEIDLSIEEFIDKGYFKCRVCGARKAKTGRSDIRFKIQDEEVIATNFKISKHTIDVSNFNIPTGIKVILEQFHSSNSGLSDLFRVNVFGSKDPILSLVKKTGKILYIEDVSNPDSYTACREDCIDLSEYLGDDLNNYIMKGKEHGYKSTIIMPIIYLAETGKTIPFAYIMMISKSEIFTMEKVDEIQKMASKLVERISDANTQFMPVHQDMLDISRGGACLRIEDADLTKYLKSSDGFIFDVLIKMQAPITIYGAIIYTNTDGNGNLFLGIDFAGNTSRKQDIRRLYSYIKPKEAEYKRKLLKSIKSK